MYGHFFANCLILLNGVSTVVVVELQHGDAIARCDQAAAAINPEKECPSVCAPDREPHGNRIFREHL
jgi:hypothetical protein